MDIRWALLLMLLAWVERLQKLKMQIAHPPVVELVDFNP
jgi:hypothetical protein